jgi:hypothetical protein
MALFTLGGCETLKLKENSSLVQHSYGEYYLTLQQLSDAELTEEIAMQINAEKTGSQQAKIKLLFLYSLPKSPIYNTFNAKALLNQLQNNETNQIFSTITPEDQAFITLLYDQLNQRLLMRNRLLAEQQRKDDLALKQRLKFEQEIFLLQQTINQLKKIEQTINKREQ